MRYRRWVCWRKRAGRWARVDGAPPRKKVLSFFYGFTSQTVEMSPPPKNNESRKVNKSHSPTVSKSKSPQVQSPKSKSPKVPKSNSPKVQKSQSPKVPKSKVTNSACLGKKEIPNWVRAGFIFQPDYFQMISTADLNR